MNIGGSTLNLGDDGAKRQYLGVLSFNTGANIPDNATITSVVLKVKKQAISGNANLVAIFQGFMADIKNGFFSTTSGLQITDFQAAGSGTVGPTNGTLNGAVYSINLTNGKTFINILNANSGLTQIRLRFKLDDNNDTIANVLSLYSGDATLAADRPELIITYTLP